MKNPYLSFTTLFQLLLLSLLPAQSERSAIFFYTAPEALSQDAKASSRAKIEFYVQGAQAMEKIELYPNTISYQIPLAAEATAVNLFRLDPKSTGEEPAYLPLASAQLTDAASNQLLFVAPTGKQSLQMRAYNISAEEIPEDAHCFLNIANEDLAFRCEGQRRIIRNGERMVYKANNRSADALRFILARKEGERWKPAKSHLIKPEPRSQKLLLIVKNGSSLGFRNLALHQPREGYDLERQKEYNEPATFEN
ncbi:hypothetical protein [Roseibacillus ishigakijimensis]|uniref:P pilus assembly protein, chaperone PapD n=1 Tax=Roseibacillus ishigakijimensis TaxID=454146 RepID=A0A934VJI1_9BACT|nr:hypothetical protein [Roseibacillus ishigakijimensis]MBK1832624.1 hypothetical protein [Roseibacillus ishigakijimensis]